MGVNCLIFAGDSSDYTTKYAGPYRIATELRKNGYTVQVIEDCSIKDYNLFYKLVIKKFVDKDTLWIGISSNFMKEFLGYNYTESSVQKKVYHEQFPDSDRNIKKLMEHARSYSPGVKFIVGGIKTFNLDHLGFYRFKGYTDQAIVDFTNAVKNNVEIKNNLIEVKEFNNFVKSCIDFTDHDVFNNEKSLPIEISRGCIFKCKFCRYPLIGKSKFDYIRDCDLIREEMIRNYERFGITHYNFADDTYNDSVYKINTLLEHVYSKLPFKITFAAYLRLDLLMRFPEMEDILVESGLKSALFGIETLDATNAKIIGKGVDPKKQIETIARLKQDKFKDITCASGFIIGLPNDNLKSINDSINWLGSKDNPLDGYYVGTLSLYPDDYAHELPYKSEFDYNYKKYGYEFYYDSMGGLRWKNDAAGFNDTELTKLTNEMYESDTYDNKCKYVGFRYSYMLDLGYNPGLITTKTINELSKIYDHNKLVNTKLLQYQKNLLQLS